MFSNLWSDSKISTGKQFQQSDWRVIILIPYQKNTWLQRS